MEWRGGMKAKIIPNGWTLKLHITRNALEWEERSLILIKRAYDQLKNEENLHLTIL